MNNSKAFRTLLHSAHELLKPLGFIDLLVKFYSLINSSQYANFYLSKIYKQNYYLSHHLNITLKENIYVIDLKIKS